MKRVVAYLTILLAPIALPAQNGAKPDGTTLNFKVIPTVGACPIGMHARQGVWDHTVAVKKGLPDRGFGQRITLSLVDTRSAQIVSATVKVHGLTGRNHMLQTSGGAIEDAIRTMRIAFTSEKDGSVSSDLYVSGFTSVTAVQLIEVSYADGSVWKTSAPASCRVAPDPLMLIAEH